MTDFLRIWSLRKLPSLFTRLFFGFLVIGLLVCFSIAFSSSAFANTTSPSHTVPFEQLERGQYTIEVSINDSEPLKFMIDTAASRTSIFNETRLRLGLDTDSAQKFINGMTKSGYRPTSTVDKLSFGRHVFTEHNIIILKDWDKAIYEGLDGILGMDVFDNLVFAFSHKTKTVKISVGAGYSKSTGYSKSKYRRWKKVRLADNPYPVEKFGLLFTYTQFGDVYVPTLLDTGANFSAINWKSVKGTTIAKERRRLREEWIIQGSIGAFKPRLRVRFEQANIGGIKLKQHEFLVMNFDNFPVNNYGAYPLVIAGIDIFEGRDFTLDFAENHLYIAPKPRKLSINTRSSRIKRKGDE
ncbi:MAG: retropepsin-like domain-containing protein [Robiginitomaculum sp.]|nr:retropepsin-like domain-containing protein [Robiginitomaculum sp.]